MPTTMRFPPLIGDDADHHNEELRRMAELKICALHEDLSDIVTGTSTTITKTSNDVGWIKHIAWAILVAAVAATGSIWGVFYPYIVNVSDKVHRHDTMISEINRQLTYHEKVDEEGKQDRRELRAMLTEIRNIITAAHKDELNKR